ncbi:unnamed protein product [Moneuplotes crassus]|uniref:Uncharacterized protein n=1 Tax=Euplotes crassus TaxID=5936 RepID=A0AAD1UIV4_EUPCR|nr:unnamed protein product [Moneuplotes crassus]
MDPVLSSDHVKVSIGMKDHLTVACGHACLTISFDGVDFVSNNYPWFQFLVYIDLSDKEFSHAGETFRVFACEHVNNGVKSGEIISTNIFEVKLLNVDHISCFAIIQVYLVNIFLFVLGLFQIAFIFITCLGEVLG